MVFSTERLIIRPWNENDAESCFKYASHPEVGPSAGWNVHRSVEESRMIIKTVLSVPETYAVCLKEDNIAIGCAGLTSSKDSNIRMAENEYEIGYWLGVPFWGKGIIPEAVRCLMKYAFETLRSPQLWSGYFDGNDKSRRVQEKCGLIYRYTLKNFIWPITNEIKTEHITSITYDDYLRYINKEGR